MPLLDTIKKSTKPFWMILALKSVFYSTPGQNYHLEENGYTFNENGVPCCPHDSTLPMKRGRSKSSGEAKLPT